MSTLLMPYNIGLIYKRKKLDSEKIKKSEQDKVIKRERKVGEGV